MTCSAVDISRYKRHFRILFVVLILFRLAYIALSHLSLSPEEAYYWNYFKHPDLSYFDHPPMVAWVIGIFTTIFGNSEFAVRLGAVALSAGFLFFVHKAALELYGEKAGFHSVFFISLAFVYNLYSTGITPDSPLFFFWALSLYLFLRACKSESKGLWILLGAAMGMALLSKYTAAFLPLSFGVYLIWNRAARTKWINFVLACFIALIVFMPVIIWNINNNFASFAFQSSDRLGKGLSFSIMELLNSQLLQAAFFTPFLYFGAVYILFRSLWDFVKTKSIPREHQFLLSMSLPMIIFFGAVSGFHWVKFNWTPPGFISAFILFSVCFGENFEKTTGWRKNLLTTFLITAVVFALLLNGLAYFQPVYPKILPALSKGNTMAGWPELAERVKKNRETMPGGDSLFIAGHGYQIASELQFYLYPDRGQEIYSSNIFNEPALAFDFWQKTEALEGRNAVLVTGDFIEFNPDVLDEFFENHDEPEIFSVEIEGVKVREFRIYRCYGYKLHK